MECKATAKYVRLSPKKIQRYLNMVRGADVETAVAKLEVKKTPAAVVVKKLLNSAAAQGSGKLFVKTIFATPAPALKRMRPGPFGRACPYKRRSSHITVALSAMESNK
ncbi:MAG: 50S ribosomal protein L22 [Elusimicrobia bacterium CG_4_10_14_3_um_filter_49_12_50_7]|nr:MAG: 50S ribosomal protein L22 [Elusimicrobia bacterium CG03_land_8_20_14_0_80_50_18]PIX13748.1 MAG: 50S ribosomal protein L22 [Elusimicrobia bacterium CG_4_8_14_3_um_filter_50_9]PIY15142.1 MAG: 50S ribosomal protein L22 [Elusimicrobia bacterium CG_4_10_14_3_um_filter_49_12_50_7]